MGEQRDTIAAIATARGPGGMGVVRVSGPVAGAIGQTITNKTLPPRQAVYAKFLAANRTPLDLGVAIFFRGPNSFTGEDVLELHGHGGVVVLDLLLARVIALGARLARPGEFSERAFLNNKIDLTQAEAIASLIAAQSTAAAQAAVRSLQGVFSQKVQQIVAGLITLRQQIEAAIDFVEEELELCSPQQLRKQLAILQHKLQQLLPQVKQGLLLEDGVRLAIVGPPNVGKSSLLNLLTGEDTAIVTEIPGTTRDIVRAVGFIAGVRLEFVDTAGLRETTDIVEQEGIRRARQVINQAGVLLLVVDVADNNQVPQLVAELEQQKAATTKIVIVHNKIDLLDKPATVVEENGLFSVFLSAKTGEGLDLLQQTLKKVLALDGQQEPGFIARRRHLLALEAAEQHFNVAAELIAKPQGVEILAEELRLAQQQLGEITGEFSADDLLGRIFAEFCIGK